MLDVAGCTKTANMSVVSLLGVSVNNNPAKFTDNYEFEITFECLEQLEKGTVLCLTRPLCDLLTSTFQISNGS